MSKGDPGFLDHLVDRHVALLDVRQRLEVEAEEAAGPRGSAGPGVPTDQGPWMSVSMGLGTRGEEIAAQVGEQLGWRVFDREILEAIARTTHTRERLLSRLDERAIGKLEEFFTRFLMPREPSQSVLLNDMMQVVWALGREGQAILLGRGANWILSGEGGLRVRLTAPLAARVAQVAGADDLSEADAERKVHADDARRAGFIRQAYGRNIGEPLGYDLTLNTHTLGEAVTVQLILAALEMKVHPKPVDGHG